MICRLLVSSTAPVKCSIIQCLMPDTQESSVSEHKGWSRARAQIQGSALLRTAELESCLSNAVSVPPDTGVSFFSHSFPPSKTLATLSTPGSARAPLLGHGLLYTGLRALTILGEGAWSFLWACLCGTHRLWSRLSGQMILLTLYSWDTPIANGLKRGETNVCHVGHTFVLSKERSLTAGHHCKRH